MEFDLRQEFYKCKAVLGPYPVNKAR